jgi:phage terminase small subunit
MRSELKPQHQLFAEAIATGATGEEAVEAAGYKSRGKAAQTQRTRLMGNDGVKAEVERLQAESTNSSIMTAIELKESLTRLLKVAEADQDFGGFSSLADRLCKVSGYFEPQQIESIGTVTITIGGDNE